MRGPYESDVCVWYVEIFAVVGYVQVQGQGWIPAFQVKKENGSKDSTPYVSMVRLEGLPSLVISSGRKRFVDHALLGDGAAKRRKDSLVRRSNFGKRCMAPRSGWTSL